MNFMLEVDERSSYLNSNQISAAAPAGKNFRQDRVSDVTVSKCRCLNLHPSGPVFLLSTTIEKKKKIQPSKFLMQTINIWSRQ